MASIGKKGLKVRDVDKHHFSSGIVKEPQYSRFVVRFIEGKRLLASDIETGKSDPVAFVWCGGLEDTPDLADADNAESGIMKTEVCPTTVDPIWNEDVVFPLDMSDVRGLADTRCLIYIRDQDVEADGSLAYDELGMVELPFRELMTKGKALKSSIVQSARWYPLKKTTGMRRVDGTVKLTVSLIFGSDDSDAIMQQVDVPATMSTNFSRSSLTQLHSVAQRVQRCIAEPAGAPAVDPRLHLSLTNLPRPSSAASARSSRSNLSLSQVAPMVHRRPQTAPQRDRYNPRNLEESRESEEEGGGLDLDFDLDLGRVPEEEELDDIIVPDLLEGDVVLETEGGEGDELIVVKGSGKPKQVGLKGLENIRVEVGGFDMQDLLPTGDDGFLEDFVRLGLTKAQEVLQEADVDVGDEMLEGARRLAKRLKRAASRLLGGQVEMMEPELMELLQAETAKVHKGAKATQSAKESTKAVYVSPRNAISLASKQVQALAQTLLSEKTLGEEGGINPENAFLESAGGVEDPLRGPLGGDQAGNFEDEDEEEDIGAKVSPEVQKPVALAAAAATAGAEREPEVTQSPAPVAVATAATPSVAQQLVPQTQVQTLAQTEAQTEAQTQAQGNATAMVRALKEIVQQRRLMEQGLQKIASATSQGFEKLSTRIAHIERTIEKGGGRGGDVGEFGPPDGDEDMPEEEEERGDKKRRLNSTTPARLQSKGRDVGAGKGKGGRGVGAQSHIAQAKAAARARRPVSAHQHQPFASFEEPASDQRRGRPGGGGGGGGGGMGGGEPMLMLRGMDGRVGAVALDQPAPSPHPYPTMGLGSPYQQQGQQGQARPESYSPHGGGHPSFGDQGMGGGMGHGMGQGMGGVGSSQEGKYPLNREFSDVLERGSLSDIAHLLEGTPRPEQLSISVRNRLYDAVATLLQQNSHAERALIWTLALVRGAGLGEVAGHTRRDLQEALEQLAQEPSKRGLLASLIRSQLRR